MSRFTIDQLSPRHQAEAAAQLHGKPPAPAKPAVGPRLAGCVVCGEPCFHPAQGNTAGMCELCEAAGCVPRRPVAVAGQTKPAQPKTAPRQPRPAKGQGKRVSQLYAHPAPHSDGISPRPVPQCPAGRAPLSTSAPQARGAGRYLVRVTSFRIRLLDEDNLVVKWFVDALRYAGVLPSDAPDCAKIEVAQVKVAHKHEEKTVIEVTPPESAKERTAP